MSEAKQSWKGRLRELVNNGYSKGSEMYNKGSEWYNQGSEKGRLRELVNNGYNKGREWYDRGSEKMRSIIGGGFTRPDASPCANGGKAADAQVERIIHSASALAGVTDGLAAQLPFVGASTVTMLQCAMVSSIAWVYGLRLDMASAMAVLPYLGSNIPQTIAREVVGYFPIAGNVAKAVMSFGFTEGLGLAAKQALRCPTSAGALLEQAAASNSAETKDLNMDDRSQQTFEILRDYLGNLRPDLSGLSPAQVWRQLRYGSAHEPLLQRLLNAKNSTEFEGLLRAANVTRPAPVLEGIFESLLQGGDSETCERLLLALNTLETSRDWPTLQSLAAVDAADANDPLHVDKQGCFSSLRTALMSRIALSEMPADLEFPAVQSHRAATPGPSTTAAQKIELLRTSIAGQECALRKLEPDIRLRTRGMQSEEKPLVLLFTGPSGVGKTLLSSRLAEILLGQPAAELQSVGRFKTFDMNVFTLAEDQKTMFGTPKGIRGGPGELIEVLKAWPDAVIVFDEIEKAHSSFSRAFLKVFGEKGTVFDPTSGEYYPTTQATFILTSNLAKHLIEEHIEIGIDSECKQYEELQRKVGQALRDPRPTRRSGMTLQEASFFSESELRGRLTVVLPFLPFNGRTVVPALRRLLAEEAKIYSSSPKFGHIEFAWEPEVLHFFAAEYSKAKEEGLRPVQRLIQSQVRELILTSIDLGVLTPTCLAVLRTVAGRLDMYSVARRLSDTGLNSEAEAGDENSTGSPVAHELREMVVAAVSHLPTAWLPSVFRGGPQGDSGFDSSSLLSEWSWRQSEDWSWENLWQLLWQWVYVIIVVIALVVTFSATMSVTAAWPWVVGYCKLLSQVASFVLVSILSLASTAGTVVSQAVPAVVWVIVRASGFVLLLLSWGWKRVRQLVWCDD